MSLKQETTTTTTTSRNFSHTEQTLKVDWLIEQTQSDLNML